MLHETPADIVAESDVIVIGDAKAGQALATELGRPGLVVIDLVRMSRDRRSEGTYLGLSW
jgi:choline dehydrogenase-like flavoprotein